MSQTAAIERRCYQPLLGPSRPEAAPERFRRRTRADPTTEATETTAAATRTIASGDGPVSPAGAAGTGGWSDVLAGVGDDSDDDGDGEGASLGDAGWAPIRISRALDRTMSVPSVTMAWSA